MTKEQFVRRHLIAVILSFAMILSGVSLQAFAKESPEALSGTLKLGTKQSITFENESSKFYKITIPKKGLYRIDYYSTYHDDYNKDFWVGLYKSQSDAEEMENLVDSNLFIRNNDNPDTDYEIYSLSARTYYLHVQSFSSKRPNFGIKVKAATDDDLYDLESDGRYYAGMYDNYVGVGYYNPEKDKGYEGKVTSIVSSNKAVVKVNKGTAYDERGKKFTLFTLDYKKAGTAKLTIKYTRPGGKKATLKKTLVVKKYPNMIKSLKVNGKSVTISKNKFRYSVKSYKKTSAKIKLTAKSGWKVKEVTGDYYGKSYKYSELKKSVVTKGTSISFPKKYDHVIFYIYMENKNGDSAVYEVDMFR